MSGGPAGPQTNPVFYILLSKIPSPQILSNCVILRTLAFFFPCTFLYHCDILLYISPANMPLPLKSAPPHANYYSHLLHNIFGTVICNSILQLCIETMSEHYLMLIVSSCFLCQRPDFITIHQCRSKSCFVQ